MRRRIVGHAGRQRRRHVRHRQNVRRVDVRGVQQRVKRRDRTIFRRRSRHRARNLRRVVLARDRDRDLVRVGQARRAIVRAGHRVGEFEALAGGQEVEQVRTSAIERPVELAVGGEVGIVAEREEIEESGIRQARRNEARRVAADRHRGLRDRHGVAGVLIGDRQLARGGGRAVTFEDRGGVRVPHRLHDDGFLVHVLHGDRVGARRDVGAQIVGDDTHDVGVGTRGRRVGRVLEVRRRDEAESARDRVDREFRAVLEAGLDGIGDARGVAGRVDHRADDRGVLVDGEGVGQHQLRRRVRQVDRDGLDSRNLVRGAGTVGDGDAERVGVLRFEVELRAVGDRDLARGGVDLEGAVSIAADDRPAGEGGAGVEISGVEIDDDGVGGLRLGDRDGRHRRDRRLVVRAGDGDLDGLRGRAGGGRRVRRRQRVGELERLAGGQEVEGLGVGIEVPCEGRARAVRGEVGRRRQGQHGLQQGGRQRRRDVRGARAGDGQARHRDGHRVGYVSVGHRQRAVGRKAAIGLGQVGEGGRTADDRRIVRAVDGDDDGLGRRSRSRRR